MANFLWHLNAMPCSVAAGTPQVVCVINWSGMHLHGFLLGLPSLRLAVKVLAIRQELQNKSRVRECESACGKEEPAPARVDSAAVSRQWNYCHLPPRRNYNKNNRRRSSSSRRSNNRSHRSCSCGTTGTVEALLQFGSALALWKIAVICTA